MLAKQRHLINRHGDPGASQAEKLATVYRQPHRTVGRSQDWRCADMAEHGLCFDWLQDIPASQVSDAHWLREARDHLHHR